MNINKISFGNKLKKARISQKATLREVSQYIGKSIGYISDIEHDRKRPPNLETVEKIEEFLDINDGSLINLANKIRRISKQKRTEMDIRFHKPSETPPPKDGTTRIVGVFNDLGIDLNDVSIAEYDTYRKVWRLVGPYSVYYKKDPKIWAYYEDLERLI